MSPHEKNYELETKYEDETFFLFDTNDNAPFGCRMGTAKTDYGLCAG